jgi:Fe-S-cluster containining protein
MTEHERLIAPTFALKDHNLDYIPNLRLGEELLTARFEGGCSMSSCSAYCCRDGVIVDVAHRDRLLAEAELIAQYMEPGQEHDSSRWFEETEMDDIDFPSGRAANTRVVNGTCVFLDSQRRCVLQRAEEQSPGLKPFYCRTYPIVIINGRITIDDEHCPDENQCCGPMAGGSLTALDVCSYELEFMLGAPAKGMTELHTLARESAARHAAPSLPAAPVRVRSDLVR